MQSAQNLSARGRMIILNEVVLDSQLREDLLVVAFEKEPSLVAKHAWLEDDYARQRSWDFLDCVHCQLCRGSALRIPSRARVAAGTPHNCCSSSRSRSFPPAPQ